AEVLSSTEESRQKVSDKLITNQTELQELRRQLEDAETRRDAVEATLLSEVAPYADGAETITGLNVEAIQEVALEDGTVVQTALEPIHRLLQTLQNTNPEAYRILSERLVDYKTAARNHAYFNETMKGLSSPEFSLPTFATKLGFSVFGDKTVNDFTAEFVNTMFESQMIAQPQIDQNIQDRIDSVNELIQEEEQRLII